MSRRATDTLIDPALAVSGLLTRVGLFLLVVVTPLLAMVSRRGVSVFVPVATALLIAAAALDGRLGTALSRFGRLVLRPASLAVLMLLAWAGVSLAWTPAPGVAAGHLSTAVLTLALFAGAVACLPARVRASDANLIPLGVVVAAVALALDASPNAPTFGLLDRGLPDLGRTSSEAQRAAMLATLLVWPAAAVLAVRGRHWQVAALGVVVAMTLWLVHDLVVLAAFCVGLSIFALASRRPRAGVPVVAAAAVGLLVLAPPIGWVMARYGGRLLPRAGDHLVAVWRDVTHALPVHLLEGFGFDASLALARGPGGALLVSPQNAALQIWLELGVVGVALAAVALGLGCAALEPVDARVRPAGLAVLSAAAVMMFSGLAAFQGWWLGMLGLTAVCLAFVSRRLVH